VHGVLAGRLEGVGLGAVVSQLGAELAYPLVGLLLLGRLDLLLGQRVVLVDGAREGRQTGRERAQRRRGEVGRLRGV